MKTKITNRISSAKKRARFLKFYVYLIYSLNRRLLRFLSTVLPLIRTVFQFLLIIEMDFTLKAIAITHFLISLICFSVYAYHTKRVRDIRKTLNPALRLVKRLRMIKKVRNAVRFITFL